VYRHRASLLASRAARCGDPPSLTPPARPRQRTYLCSPTAVGQDLIADYLPAAGPGDWLSTLSEVSDQRLIAASQMIRRSHPGSPDTRCLELPGQRHIRIPAGPHAQAGEITGHDPERETESDDHHDPLSHVQPVNPAHRPTLAAPSRPRGRICRPAGERQGRVSDPSPYRGRKASNDRTPGSSMR